jgi:hypothetical protein
MEQQRVSGGGGSFLSIGSPEMPPGYGPAAEAGALHP